jgi:hypothetical protein
MRFRGFLGGMGNVDPCFGPNCVKDAYGGAGGVGVKNGNRSVDRH